MSRVKLIRRKQLDPAALAEAEKTKIEHDAYKVGRRRGYASGYDDGANNCFGKVEKVSDALHVSVLDSAILALSIAEGLFPRWWGGKTELVSATMRVFETSQNENPEQRTGLLHRTLVFEDEGAFLVWAMLKVIVCLDQSAMYNIWRHGGPAHPVSTLQLFSDHLNSLDRPWPYGSDSMAGGYAVRHHNTIDDYRIDKDFVFATCAEFLQFFRKMCRTLDPLSYDPITSDHGSRIVGIMAGVLGSQYGNRTPNWFRQD